MRTVNPEVAVSCQGVTKEFGRSESRVMALRGVDMDVRLGDLTLLVGPSGCGKTTLLSVVAGLLDRTAGTVVVLGRNLAGLAPAERVVFRRKNLGFVFQQFNLLPALTAAENAAMPLLAAGVPRRQAFDRAAALLANLGMGDRAHAVPAELSGGQQQRVALARALVHEPRLVICDEPTSALDAATGQAVMKLLASVAVRPNRAVLVVTHDSRVFGFADRIVYMNDGRVVGEEIPVQSSRRSEKKQEDSYANQSIRIAGDGSGGSDLYGGFGGQFPAHSGAAGSAGSAAASLV